MFIVHSCVHHSCVQGNVYLTSYLKVSQKMHILSSGILKKILNLNGERNTPLFPISLWNNFHLVPQGLLRSTNLVEAWHRGFQSTCGCHHPTIWKSIDCLKTEQDNVELKQLKFTHGEDPKKTKKSIDNEKAILNLVTSFFHRPILVYLRGLAFRTIF